MGSGSSTKHAIAGYRIVVAMRKKTLDFAAPVGPGTGRPEAQCTHLLTAVQSPSEIDSATLRVSRATCRVKGVGPNVSGN